MGFYDEYNVFHPGRRSDFNCSICKRVFERGHVPAPNITGERICRDCLTDGYGLQGKKKNNAPDVMDSHYNGP